MQIKLKTLIIICAIFIFIFGGFIWYTSYLNNVIKGQTTEIAKQKQNQVALQNQISMQKDSIQNFAIFVKDLQKEKKTLKNEYTLLHSKYVVLLDSIYVLNKPTQVDTNDSTIVVSFAGKKGKVSYKGHTTYFKITGKGTYTITIGVDSSTVNSDVYLDVKDGLIKNRIYIDGALITNAKTEIDSSLYTLIQQKGLNCQSEPGFFDKLHLLFDANQSIKKNGLIYEPYKFSMDAGAEYEFGTYRIYTKYDYLNTEIKVGIQYHPSITDLWKAIFK